MYTKAMRKDTIFQSEEEDSMNPHRLFEELLHLSTTLCKIMETPEIGSMDSNPSPVVGFSNNLASIADSLTNDGLVLTEEGNAKNEEHRLKRNGHNRGMSARHHRWYLVGGALDGH